MKLVRLICAMLLLAAPLLPAGAQPITAAPTAQSFNREVAQQAGPLAVGTTMAQVNPATGGVAIVTQPQQHAVDLSPVTDPLIQALAAIASALGTWVVGYVLRYMHLQHLSLVRDMANKAVQQGIGAAVVALRQKYASGKVDVDLHNDLLNEAAGFAVDHFPGALKRLGLTFDKNGDLDAQSLAKLHDLVESQLGKLSIDASAAAGAAHPVTTAIVAPAPAAPAGAPDAQKPAG